MIFEEEQHGEEIEQSKGDFPQTEVEDVILVLELDHFMQRLEKHIDLLERRVLKGEKIPHLEKMFFIFEDYTEWITNGKMRPSVELNTLVMPKKGKCNKKEQEEEEQRSIFKRLRHKHSAVESNINELVNRGLNK